MKILKIFGVVVGIHVFALVLIFANPGCSSTSKPAPAPIDTVSKGEASPALTLPLSAPAHSAPAESTYGSPPPAGFNPDAPAMAAPSAGTGGSIRFVPTRPGTPVAGALVAEPVVDVTPAATYLVKSGDSLWSIAKKHNLALAELAAANSLSANAKLQLGQKLLIPGKPASALAAATAKGATGPTSKAVEVAPAAARGSSDGVKHIVKSGETLGIIARNFGVKQGDIAVANNISDPAKIQAGMELIIPGWQTPSGKNGKASSKSGSGSGTKAGDQKAGPVGEPTPLPTAPPAVPVIPIFDNPITPAPRP